MTPLSRRRLLRGAAGAALALPFLEAMLPRRATAQTTSVRRILFEFKPNGDQVSRRFTTSGETDFELDEFLEPLEPYQGQLLFLNNLNKNFNRLPKSERADQHQQGGSSLAPWPSGEGDFPVGGEDRTIGYVLGPSADYVLGDRVLTENPTVPLRHLVFRVGDRSNTIWTLSSHAGPVGTKNPVLPETDPWSAYANIFGFGTDQGSEAEFQHQLAMRRSILDLVAEDSQRLAARLSPADRQRLELHEEAVRDLERSLVRVVSSSECQPVELGDPVDVYSDDEHALVGALFFKLSALAFACDLTRVVSFNWGGNTNQRVYRNLGLRDGHHDISHRTDEESFASIRQIHRHLWTQSLGLYEQLLATPDGEGNLWDHTLVVHWNELGQGDTHSTDDCLVVLAGGADGHFRRGRLLDYDGDGAFSTLLVSCFHFMGFEDVQTFGDERLADGPGPLGGLRS